MAELIDRRRMKADVKELLKTAEVPARLFAVFYLGLTALLQIPQLLVDLSTGGEGIFSIFSSVLLGLLSTLLTAGFVLYCMAIRRGERAEYLTLFDGFSMAGKIIVLHILIYVFISLWASLFVFPGIWAAYRYRFALYNLYENPDLSPFEALNMSKAQTRGYKLQLFMLDFSYVGWLILSGLPASFMVMDTASGVLDFSFAPAAFVGSSLFFVLSVIWTQVIQIFYLPSYQCTELGFFETAKRTSGIGADIDPTAGQAYTRPMDGRGPDGLGGF